MRPIPTCEKMHKANFSWEYTVESVESGIRLEKSRFGGTHKKVGSII